MIELPSDCYFYMALHDSKATMKKQTDKMVSLLKSHLLTNFTLKRHDFAIRKRGVLWTSTHNVST